MNYVRDAEYKPWYEGTIPFMERRGVAIPRQDANLEKTISLACAFGEVECVVGGDEGGWERERERGSRSVPGVKRQIVPPMWRVASRVSMSVRKLPR